MESKNVPMQRRLRFSLLVMVSQILLVALALSWLAHMGIIAVAGSVYFIENNPLVLWGEISVTVLITAFAIYVLVGQIQRLGERRGTDADRRRAGDSPGGDAPAFTRRAGDRRSADTP